MRKFFDLKEIELIKRNLFSGYDSCDPALVGADKLTTELSRVWEDKFMTRLDNEQFDFLLSKLDEQVALFSFGEGEFSFLIDKKSSNEREVYTQEARNGLIDAIKMSSKPNVFLTTILGGLADRRVDSIKNMAVTKMINSYNGEIKEELHSARLFYDIIENTYNRREGSKERVLNFLFKLKNKKVCLVGAESLIVVKDYLPNLEIIKTPSLGVTCWMDIVEDSILKSDADVFLLSCGIAANCLIARTFEKKNKAMLDIGSFWDLILGIGTRAESSYDTPLIKLNELR